MKLGDAARATRSVLVDRPATVLPAFLAGVGVALVAQSVPLVGVALAFAVLLGSGRIDRFLETVRRVDVEPTDGVSDAAASALADAVLALFTPTTVALLLGSAAVGLVAFLVARAFVGAAQVHAVVSALEGATDSRPMAAGVEGASADGWTFLGLGVARALALLAPTVAVGALAAVAANGGGLAAGLVLFVAVLAWLPLTFAVYLLFAFAPQAIVVDDAGVVEAVKRATGFVRREPGRVVGYLVVAFGAVVATGAAAVGFQALGVGSLLQVAVAFLVTPALGVLKTALYLDPRDPGPPTAVAGPAERGATGAATDAVREPSNGAMETGEPVDATVARRTPTDGSGRGSLADAFRRGWRELVGFVAARPGLVAVALGLFAVGVAGGWTAARPYSTPVPGSVSENVFGRFPVDTFVSLTANNWTVAISTAYAGLGFGVPTVVNLLFNGALVGGVVGLGSDPVALAALVVPHGVVEIPALSVAAALGLHLGGAAWSYVRGRTSADALAEELVRTYYALLGLLPLFVVAGFVEAFLTWWVASLVV
ncbi:stage II sporulation protein M [Halomicrococcus sp. NG-SE-24]|uniref:stage II sporulation protein M n=1 Tax=Halomicrococcus sp. NG-SE-24 TaxID=3436928 RepID=UPI003D9596FB